MAMKPTQETRQIAVSSPLEDDVLLFHTMTGSEDLGRLFEFELELFSTDPAIEIDDLLGQNMTVRLTTGEDSTRYFNGIVSRFQQLGASGDLPRYRATLRPWLWFLTRTADCRIFQEKTAVEIIEEVFRAHDLTDFELKLTGNYLKREYCVQYRETDFDFVSRLMEQEGIYYFFKHDDGKHTLVLADDYGSHETVKDYDEIPYYPPDDGRSAERDHIYTWITAREVQPCIYALNEFDFKKPNTDLNVNSSVDRKYSANKFEIYDYPGCYVEPGDGEDYATRRIQELQSGYQQLSGEGNARGLTPGCLFNLSGYPREDQDGEYLLTGAEYRLESDAFAAGPEQADETVETKPFVCKFRATTTKEPYRVASRTPRPIVRGPQTATVVGPSGEEIWTDEFGRVKLQFHWDRYGQHDENSSCWVRVSQYSAGKTWGGIQLPRIGQEVVVDFLEGDPDRPLITGRVYNGTNKVPYELPKNATMSAFKSNSSKGGGGFNELRFEDKKEEEQIFLHAQKNYDIRVLNDRFETVVHDRNLIVENDKKEHVKNDRSETIDRHHHEKVGGERHLKVAELQAVEIGKSLSVTVKDDVLEVFKKNHSEQVTSDYYLKADNIVIEASTNVTIKVGQSFIAIEAGGIKLGTTGDIVLEATGKGNFKGTSGLTLESPATAELKSASTTVKGDGMCTIQGGMVKIN